MKITPEIKAAIGKAIEHYGNVTQFAKNVGLAHSTVLFWQNGKTTEVSGRVWAQKLRPALLPFMDDPTFAPSQTEGDILLKEASAHIMEGLRLLVKVELAKIKFSPSNARLRQEDGKTGA
jgi:hypothetical protein